MHKNNCRVCGYTLKVSPWGEDEQTPSWEICPCCGTEFEYEDNTIKSVKIKRTDWIKKGEKWFDEKENPNDWSFEKQKTLIPNLYR